MHKSNYMKRQFLIKKENQMNMKNQYKLYNQVIDKKLKNNQQSILKEWL